MTKEEIFQNVNRLLPCRDPLPSSCSALSRASTLKPYAIALPARGEVSCNAKGGTNGAALQISFT